MSCDATRVQEAMQHDSRFRQPLPLGFAASGNAEAQAITAQRAHELVQLLGAHANSQKAADIVGLEVASGLLPPRHPQDPRNVAMSAHESDAAARQVDGETCIRFVSSLPFVLASTPRGDVFLSTAQNQPTRWRARREPVPLPSPSWLPVLRRLLLKRVQRLAIGSAGAMDPRDTAPVGVCISDVNALFAAALDALPSRAAAEQGATDQDTAREAMKQAILLAQFLLRQGVVRVQPRRVVEDDL